MFDNEHKKATDKGGGSSDVDKLPSFSAIVDGIGKVHTDRLISERSTRSFSDLEDCYETT
ncbi:hypothetical protein RhiirA4_550580 [Rhizophagus irregularis]|uniref:Uncharacterized protein n=1 Tax=Rhizophagus irregularis TaxID=588596 RepID=A0A2I1HMW2_9GLOM|nr:hypothetical protein RhiirA4_550580 [Rhizophagus irregularis]